VISHNIARKLAALVSRDAGLPAERAQGTVTRVDDDGTVWVQLFDGEEETPCTASMVAVTEGDVVSVTIDNGTATVDGNASRPSTDDGAAQEARVIADKAAEDVAFVAGELPKVRNAASSIAQAAQGIAAEAQAIAAAVNQHFWHDGQGVHVTEAAGDATTEHNVLINSLGFLLRKATAPLMALSASAVAFYDGLGDAAANIVARFGKDGSQIGKDGESHVELDYHSMKLVDKEGNTYFHVSDLRNAEGYATIVDTFSGNGSITRFSLTYRASSLNYSVTADGTEAEDVTKNNGYVTFATAPAAGATIVVTYDTTSADLKVYTLGTRNSRGKFGGYSMAEGYNVIASGVYTHAEGCNTRAEGKFSHAEGWSTTASGAGSHAEGYGAWASNLYSHAEGNDTTASGAYSHAEGYNTTTYDIGSHAEGVDTTANGVGSHAEGFGTTASGVGSHAQNRDTIAASESQTAMGRYNEEDANDIYALIIGNGTADDARSNAYAVQWDGTVETALDVPWTLLALNSACHAYNDATANAPRYRRWGQLVTITGIIAPTSEVAAGGNMPIATLPAGVRPPQEIDVKCQGSYRAAWCLKITAAGVMTAQRYGDENGAQAMGTGIWMPFTVTYLV